MVIKILFLFCFKFRSSNPRSGSGLGIRIRIRDPDQGSGIRIRNYKKFWIRIVVLKLTVISSYYFEKDNQQSVAIESLLEFIENYYVLCYALNGTVSKNFRQLVFLAQNVFSCHISRIKYFNFVYFKSKIL